MSGCDTCNPEAGCTSAKPKMLSEPPTGKDMVKIALNLTVICLISAAILGWLYNFTEPVKIENALKGEARTLRSLLEVPESGKIEEVRRYMTDDLQPVYVTPKFLVRYDENGAEKLREPVPAGLEGEKLDEWARKTVPSKYVGRFFVGKNGEQTLGYVVEGKVTGYKAGIRFFVALDDRLNIRGVEILEQEEDPGLGGEVVKRYFKNQFAGRSPDELEAIQVVKDPLNAEWRAALENLGTEPYSAWIAKNGENVKKNGVIYAITGSTISSESVTRGVKKTLGNFRKRLDMLKGVL